MNQHEFLKEIAASRTVARGELQNRWDAWSYDLDKEVVHDVVGSLMARQVSLFGEMAENPAIWNDHIAPLILRAMVEAYITVVWIMKDPEDRARKYVLYGLGQEKLLMEHEKKELKERGKDPAKDELIKLRESWINMQQYTFLTDVNLGSWSGISVRKMAEEIGALKLNNLVYQRMSATVHSMWHHVGKYNTSGCTNPLHRYHKVPIDPDIRGKLHFFQEATYYLDTTFKAFDKEFGIVVNGTSTWDTLECLYESFFSDDDTNETDRAETSKDTPQ